MSNGASFVCKGSGITVLSRHIYAVGSGFPGLGGSLVSDGGGQTSALSIHLNGDAEFYEAVAGGEATTLRNTNMYFDGRKLTLRGASTTSRYYIPGGDTFVTHDTGAMVLDGVGFYSRETTKASRSDSSVAVGLVLTNAAYFKPGTQAMIDAFESITATADSTFDFGGYDAAALPDFTIRKLTGAPIIGSRLASLAIAERLTVNVSDLKAGKSLSTTCPLSFGDDCVICVNGDLNELNADAVTVASSTVSLTGVPRIGSGSYSARHWKLEVSGNQLRFVAIGIPEGAIDVTTEWGVTAGAGVSGNAKKFNDGVAACADGSTIYFPAGEYEFDEPLVIGKKRYLKLCGKDGYSILKATGSSMTSILEANGSSSLGVSGLVFANCGGVAVAANGAFNTSVTNCWYDEIGGAISGVADGTYPVSATDSTNMFVRCNQTLDNATYTEHLYMTGTSNIRSGSEPLGADGIVLVAGTYETVDFETALKRSGRGSYPTGGNARLYKAGEGTLIGTNLYGSLMKGLTIERGTYTMCQAGDIGISEKDITVKNGGTLYVVAEPEYILLARQLNLDGFGAYGRKGAVVFAEKARTYYSAMAVNLTSGDASMYNESTSENILVEIFRHGTLQCFNHAKLYLRSAKPSCGFITKGSLKVTAGADRNGELVVDGCRFKADETSDGASYGRGAKSMTSLVLTNSATFTVCYDYCLVPFSGIVSCPGSVIKGGNADIDLSIADWTGSAALDSNIKSLSITNSYTVRAGDLLGGGRLAATNAVNFASGTKYYVADVDELEAQAPSVRKYTVVDAGTYISSTIPERSPSARYAGWRLRRTDDTKQLELYRNDNGMLLFVQ